MSVTSPTQTEMRGLAKSVLTKNLQIKKGESLVIEAWSNSLPYAEAVQLEARKMGAKPLIIYDSEPGYWDAVEAGAGKVIGEPGRAEWSALQNADAYLYFWGPTDRGRIAALPPKKAQELAAYNPKWYETAAKKKVRAFRMEIALAEPVNAERYGIDLATWRKELWDASFVDPKEMARTGAKVGKAFEKGKRVKITHPNGTNLALGLKKGRKAIVQDGRIDAMDLTRKNNVDSLPAGSVVIAVDENVADGTIVSDRKFRVAGRGYTAEGGRWEFAKGKLVSYSYESGGDKFAETYDKGPKGKERPGLLEVGLNPLMREAPTFEDQESGTITLYVGGNANFGGASKVPFVTYNILSGASLEVDGRPVVTNGKIQ
ncbi:MAG: aminopeptidase [Thermoplasmata archaeon]|nr:aminopeptidase [Thermoplasmata archaeon]